ncbi:TIGR03915 family putative DNA repair protein [Flavobacterium sp. 7A]|uniref:TIGR03915 family putative DNA repair protein n=1 Tax=Flavobacterium sp. 7A TaxID=2940571 RepID=UPI002225E338|nr:TIGR03915 family putative DNA repair protein [Flavobacterium sp. 7A]MCW2118338.1 putative DNA metabolism protein [Flavobacterium sp. 7A]
MTQLFYDNTLEGLFTAIFEIFEFKYADPEIVRMDFVQNAFFAERVEIITNLEKSNRVFTKLEKQLGKDGIRQLLYAYLSEFEGIENLIFRVVRYAVQNPNHNIVKDFSNPDVLQVSKLVKSVGREKHRMEAFIRFELLKDGLYFAKIDPDFNVLTLIVRHFKNRYQDQRWMIYDFKRGYGVYYNLEGTEMVTLDEDVLQKFQNDNSLLHDAEIKYQKLWAEYFDHTNIKERKNIKLHIQHVPKRYWKYLTEKKIF